MNKLAIFIISGLGVAFSLWNLFNNATMDGGGSDTWARIQPGLIILGLISLVTWLATIASLLTSTESNGSNLCPYCGHGVNQGFGKCPGCRSEISWVSGHPSKIGEESKIKQKIKAEQQAQKRQQLESEVTKAYITAIVVVLLFAALVIVVIAADHLYTEQKFSVIFLAGIPCSLIFAWILFRASSVKAKLRDLTQKSNSISAKATSSGTILADKPNAVMNADNLPLDQGAEQLYSACLIYLEAGNAELALAKLQEVFKLYPTSSWATKARDTYSREKTAHDALKKAVELHQQKQFDEAIAIFQSIAQKYPSTLGANKSRKILERENEAAKLYENVLRLNNSGNKKETLDALHDLVARYPQTIHGAKAQSAINKSG
jgi:TolA-binding protein